MDYPGYRYKDLGSLKIYTRTVRSALCLPEAERLVLLFILDRTIGWNKAAAFIPSSEFAKGVPRRRRGKRTLLSAGTNLPPDQLNEALTGLKERGAVEIERLGSKVSYKINEHWCHPDLHGSGMWEINEPDYLYKIGEAQGETPARVRKRVEV